MHGIYNPGPLAQSLHFDVDSDGTQEYVGSDRSDPASPYLSMGPDSSDSDATQEFVDGD